MISKQRFMTLPKLNCLNEKFDEGGEKELENKGMILVMRNKRSQRDCMPFLHHSFSKLHSLYWTT